jgi:glycosyltransferase involved in cell wall biosynthesis
MPKIHNLADIFVLPSLPIPTWQEQFGYVLVESMACGKPVISTLSGSIPEVIADAGVLVPPNDFLALSEALADLVFDKNKRATLMRMVRGRALEAFDSVQVARKLQSYYVELMAGGPDLYSS